MNVKIIKNFLFLLVHIFFVNVFIFSDLYFWFFFLFQLVKSGCSFCLFWEGRSVFECLTKKRGCLKKTASSNFV